MRKAFRLIPYGLLGLVVLLLVYLNIFHYANWLNSDMAAEMMFAKTLSDEGKYIATSNWFYSTEFRILYTQLFMVPLFGIFKSWHIVRAITNILTYILMLASYFYFMKPFKVNKGTVVATSTLLLLPFSETTMTHIQMGNTYMPHIIIIFFWMGMFLRLLDKKGLKPFRYVAIWSLYCLLSLIAGMSGVRYILVIFAPVILFSVIYAIRGDAFCAYRKSFDTESGDSFVKKTLSLIKDRTFSRFWISLAGFVMAFTGYLINSLYIAEKYVFQTYDSTNFVNI